MTRQNQEQVIFWDDRKVLLWLAEHERFRNSMKTFQRTSEEWAAQREEFNKLFVEAQSTRAEAQSLRILLDKTALQLGLQPFPFKKD